jgi:hypothetical protein
MPKTAHNVRLPAPAFSLRPNRRFAPTSATAGRYRDGVGSLGYIAEQLGLSKRDLIREARMRGIEPDFSEETGQEELA